LIEPPDLRLKTVWSLNDHLATVDNFEISVIFHSRLDVEWSFDVESILFIEFSLSWFTLPFVSIDNIPLLCDSVIWLLIDSDVLVLNILVVQDR